MEDKTPSSYVSIISGNIMKEFKYNAITSSQFDVIHLHSL